MKLPRRLLLLLPIVFISCLVLSAAFVVFAHPGSTNADGGHMNHSTGEYHYHHGYPQHNHEDRDGDGVLDCPYVFDDQTDHTYQGDSDFVNYDYDYDADNDYDVPVALDEPDPASPPTPASKEGDTSMTLPLWAKWILGLLALGLFVSVYVARSYKRDLENEKASFEAQAQASKEENEKLIRDLHALFADAYGESFLRDACGVPDQDDLGEDGLPYTESSSPLKWGPKYTFCYHRMSSHSRNSGYFYNSQRRLHYSSCRYADSGIQVNAYSVKKQDKLYTPCQICSPTLPDVEWVDKYIKYKDVFSKHYKAQPKQGNSKTNESSPRVISCGTFIPGYGKPEK